METSSGSSANPSEYSQVTAGVLIGIVLLQAAYFALMYLLSPGYVGVLFTKGTGQVVLIITIGWQVLGFWLLLKRSPSVAVTVLKWVAVIILCVIPTFLLPMLAPAVITILQALSVL